MKTFTHSGHCGDVVYSLPAIKILAGDEGAILYVKEVFEDHRGHINGNCGPEKSNYTQFDALKDLLLLQPCIKEVRPFPCEGDYGPEIWPGLKMDYDLDQSRRQRRKGYIFHVQRYFDQFGISDDWRNRVPWLTIDDKNKVTDDFAIFHITDRWHGFIPQWDHYMKFARMNFSRIVFTGYGVDHAKFVERYGAIEWAQTETLLDLARLIRDCQCLFTNQNVALVIAQGLGKKYFLAKNIDRTHCHTKLENETIIS